LGGLEENNTYDTVMGCDASWEGGEKEKEKTSKKKQ